MNKTLLITFGVLSTILFSCTRDTKLAETAAKEAADSSTVSRFFEGKLKNTYSAISDEAQSFVFSNARDTVLIGKYGSIIQIPDNSFENHQGIAPARVSLELVEALTPYEMLRNGLSTTSKDGLLESDGMIYLKALNEAGELLKVVTGKEIYLEIPSLHSVPEIQVFDGHFDQEGTMEWSNPKPIDKYLSKIPFELLDFYPAGHERMERNYSASLENNTPGAEGQFLFAQSEQSVDTVSIDRLDYCGINRGIVETLYRKQQEFQNTLISTREFETRMQYIHKSCYAEVFLLYVQNIHLNLWEIDSMAHEYLLKEDNNQASAFKIFKDQRKTKLKEGSKKDQVLANHISKSIEQYKKLKKERDLRNLTMHAFATTTLGWINLDRFLNDPAAVPVNLQVIATNAEKAQHCKTYLVFSSIQSILNLPRHDNGVFYAGQAGKSTINLPKGEKAMIVSIADDGNSPMLGIKEIIIGKNESETVVLKQVTAEQLRQQLAQYNQPSQPAILSNKANQDCCDWMYRGISAEIF
ncbi:cytochrome c, mono- and diheme variants family protein [Flammeovirgaceae bacterium 311]|nr:cytochrome c, mono- and diheme variants family protein [Flammeovirgaceae bacterium 311]